jgi:hypothetical protein
MAIAVNAALFAVLECLQFRDLPFEVPDELVAVDYRQCPERRLRISGARLSAL